MRPGRCYAVKNLRSLDLAEALRLAQTDLRRGCGAREQRAGEKSAGAGAQVVFGGAGVSRLHVKWGQAPFASKWGLPPISGAAGRRRCIRPGRDPPRGTSPFRPCRDKGWRRSSPRAACGAVRVSGFARARRCSSGRSEACRPGVGLRNSGFSMLPGARFLLARAVSSRLVVCGISSGAAVVFAAARGLSPAVARKGAASRQVASKPSANPNMRPSRIIERPRRFFRRDQVRSAARMARNRRNHPGAFFAKKVGNIVWFDAAGSAIFRPQGSTALTAKCEPVAHLSLHCSAMTVDERINAFLAPIADWLGKVVFFSVPVGRRAAAAHRRRGSSWAASSARSRSGS